MCLIIFNNFFVGFKPLLCDAPTIWSILIEFQSILTLKQIRVNLCEDLTGAAFFLFASDSEYDPLYDRALISESNKNKTKK